MVQEPRRVGQPRVSSKSFTATGTPSSGDSGADFIQRASDDCACAKVAGSSIRQKALTLPSSEAMRPNKALTTSTGEVSRLAKAAARRGAFQCQNSDMLEMRLETRQRVLNHAALLAEGKPHIG